MRGTLKEEWILSFADCIGHTVSIAAITYDNRNGCNEGESFFCPGTTW